MKIMEVIKARKSVRAYQESAVPEELLDAVVEAGQWPPNAGPFRLTVVRNAGLRQKINDKTLHAMQHSGVAFLQQRAALPGYQPLYGAPVLILVSAPAEAPYSAVNAALSAENMLLAATGAGLGSCFLVSPTLAFNKPENKELLQEAGIPDGYKLQCAVIIGYAAAADGFSLGERGKKGSVDYID